MTDPTKVERMADGRLITAQGEIDQLRADLAQALSERDRLLEAGESLARNLRDDERGEVGTISILTREALERMESIAAAIRGKP